MKDFTPGPQQQKALAQKWHRLGIKESDIKEHFVKSRGPGGQNVNKTSTRVYLKHIPSGIEVKCQKERSQALNRYLAREILADKFEAFILRKRVEERQRKELLRRQVRRHSAESKLKILEEKLRQAHKKTLRRKVREAEVE